MSDYPKWRYHATKDAVVVNNEKEEKALGAGWVDNPAQVRPAVDASKKTGQDLIAEADAKEAAEAKAKADAAKAAAAPKPVMVPQPQVK